MSPRVSVTPSIKAPFPPESVAVPLPLPGPLDYLAPEGVEAGPAWLHCRVAVQVGSRKLVGVEGYGLSVSEWVPLEIPASDSTRRYLKTKKDKLGHKLSSV